MLTLQALRLFVQVVRDGSFTKAGRSVGLSAASVSRNVFVLEDHLGVRLINRTSRKLSLTEAGTGYFDQVEAVLRELQDANDKLSELKSEPTGTLRIHAQMGIQSLIVCAALPNFLLKYPAIHVDFLTSSNAEIDLIERNIDVDIRLGRLKDSSLVGRVLLPNEAIIVGAPGYFDGRPFPKHPTDLSEHNCLFWISDATRPIWRYREKDGAHGEVNIRGSLNSDNGFVLIDAALRGIGLILVSHLAIREHLQSDRLVWVLRDYPMARVDFDIGLYAVYQKGRRLSGKLDAFISYLADFAKGFR